MTWSSRGPDHGPVDLDLETAVRESTAVWIWRGVFVAAAAVLLWLAVTTTAP
jgi:hypothetical protein